MSGSTLNFPTSGGGPVVDLALVPAGGELKLADLGGVSAELVLAVGVLGGDLALVDVGGVLDDDLDGELVPLFPSDLGGDMTSALATSSSSLGLSPSSAVVFSMAPQTLVHRLRKIPHVSLASRSDIDSTATSD